MVAVSFALAGVVACSFAPAITGPTILLVSFALGLTFAWRKVSVDTLVQEAIPDRYRGRVFAAYDLTYSMARVLAAAVAVVIIPHLSTGWILGIAGAVYLAWAPLVPWWLGRPRWVRIRFYAGGRADEVPRAVETAGEERPVEVLGSFVEDSGGRRRRRFRLEDDEGTLLEVSAAEGGRWRVDREIHAADRRR
jgi:hypothetical protein